MSLLETFAKSRLPSFVQPPEKSITTMISKVFFSGDVVVKIYKKRKYFFADLKNLTPRRQFYQEDFTWNHQMSPTIYHRLQGMRVQQGVWQPSAVKNAQDFCIIMRRIDDSKNLTHLLCSNSITPNHLDRLATSIITKLKQFSATNKTALRQLQGQWDWSEFVDQSLADNRDWAYTASSHLSRVLIDDVIAAVKKVRHHDPYFQQLSMQNMIFSIDSQSDNLLLPDHDIQFLDIMPPKPNWRINDLLYILSRPATDVSVLASPRLAQTIYQRYASDYPLPSPAVISSYEIINALIRCAYLYNLHQPHLAKKYSAYINRLLSQLS